MLIRLIRSIERVYGKELMVIIFATILTISVPAYLSGLDALTWVTIFRVILGIGIGASLKLDLWYYESRRANITVIGGDYPMSASVSTDRASLRRRGCVSSLIFN